MKQKRREGLSLDDFMQVPYDNILFVRSYILGDSGSEYHFAFFFNEDSTHFLFHPDNSCKYNSKELIEISRDFEKILGIDIGEGGKFEETPSQQEVAGYLKKIFQNYKTHGEKPHLTIDTK